MNRTVTILVILVTLAGLALAGPDVPPRYGEPLNGSSPWLRSSLSAPEKAAVDTFFVLGGPDRLDGKFETATGAPDWHGWTHHDLSIPEENHWHVSTYWAAGLNGHGPGNYALVCVDEEIPACASPDTIGGVGSNWFDDVGWVGTVSNPTLPVTVRLTAFMHYDLFDADWDFLELFIFRGETPELLEQWTGSDNDVALDFTTVLQPNELYGPYGNEVKIFWRVWSDGAWDDSDCFSPSHGACQIDDISVYFNESLVTFDNFEPGSLVNWSTEDFTGVGDFAKLRSYLPDQDPCKQNTSVQVSFIDDGQVVPGTGGTFCQTWCYGPGGKILNNDGGLLADDVNPWFLHNEIYSPVYAWIPGTDAAELAFDVFKHETLCVNCPGIFYRWGVRSTASEDLEDIEQAPWRNRNFVHYGGPEYFRHIEPVSDLIVPDAKWVQVMICVDELGWLWGWDGSDGTPAPYFDNVALKAWAAEGPEILVSEKTSFMDAFPEQGELNPDDLVSNWCRMDSALDLDNDDLRFAPGDSLVAMITPLRPGANGVGAPELHWVLACNPHFNTVRPTAPGSDNILRGMALGSETYSGSTKWAFDLPDTGWFFPGDRVHYYITAADLNDAGLKTAVWPADTTSVLDFNSDSLYPGFAQVKALPSISIPSPGVFSQPSMLYGDDGGDPATTDRVLRSLAEMGFVQGVDYDHFRTSSDGSNHVGMAASGTPTLLSGYQTMLFEAGAHSYGVLSGNADTHDDTLLEGWLDLGQKNVLLAGDGLISGMQDNANSLFSRLEVDVISVDISQLNGGRGDLQINPLIENGVLLEEATWRVNGRCPLQRRVDALNAGNLSTNLATLDPAGQSGGPYSAAIVQTDPVLGNKLAILPFSLRSVVSDPDNPPSGNPLFSARTRFLKSFLDWFDEMGSGQYSAVPDAKAMALTASPNPFNPRTTIKFNLSGKAAITLDIFDIQGRRVIQLLNEVKNAGSHQQVWNGRDGQGRQVSSGIYFYRFTAGNQESLGKLTLLK